MERAIEALSLGQAKHIDIYGAIEESTWYIRVHEFTGAYPVPHCRL